MVLALGTTLTVLGAVIGFILVIAWIVLLLMSAADIWGRKDIGVALKVGWVLVLLLMPVLGVAIYLISNGSDMARRREAGYGG